MSIKVHLRDTETGYSRVYEDPEAPDEFNPYIWEEGNYSCDCNRALFLWDWEKELPCGDGRIVIDEITNSETGEVLYSESV